MTDLETRVGLALHARIDQLAAPDDLSTRVLRHARTVRRRRWMTIGAVAVATAGVVVALSVQGIPTATDSQPAFTPTVGLPTADATGPPAEPTESATPVDPSAELDAWLDSLPTGEMPLPYTTPTTLVDGAFRIPLPLATFPDDDPGEVFSVRARVDIGAGPEWLIEARGQSGDGSGASRIGRLDLTGTFVELISAPGTLMPAVAPDGTMLASTGSPFRPGDPIRLTDIAEGTEIAVLELADTESLVGWVPSGILIADSPITDAGRSVRLAQPDGTSEPIAAAWAIVINPATDLVMLIDEDGCARIVVLSAPDVVRSEFCDGIGSISPDGRWRVGTDPPGEHPYRVAEVMDLQTGTLTHLPVPESVGSGAGWANDETILFHVGLQRDGTGPSHNGVVSCSVIELTCEVALPLATHDGAPPYVIYGVY